MSDCIIHPNKPLSSGRVVLHRRVGGKRNNVLAHRQALCDATGVPYDYELWALHTCDVGNCINPEHLYWGTPQQNQIDRAQRGPRRATLKLSAAEVLLIRQELAGGTKGSILAQRYGVSQGTISLIKNRRIWNHI